MWRSFALDDCFIRSACISFLVAWPGGDQAFEDWYVGSCAFFPSSEHCSYRNTDSVLQVISGSCIKKLFFCFFKVPNDYNYSSCFPRWNLASIYSCDLVYSQLVRCGGATALEVSPFKCSGSGSFSCFTVDWESGDHVRRLHWYHVLWQMSLVYSEAAVDAIWVCSLEQRLGKTFPHLFTPKSQAACVQNLNLK